MPAPDPRLVDERMETICASTTSYFWSGEDRHRRRRAVTILRRMVAGTWLAGGAVILCRLASGGCAVLLRGLPEAGRSHAARLMFLVRDTARPRLLRRREGLHRAHCVECCAKLERRLNKPKCPLENTLRHSGFFPIRSSKKSMNTLTFAESTFVCG
jgi:hypothetical protein